MVIGKDLRKEISKASRAYRFFFSPIILCEAGKGCDVGLGRVRLGENTRIIGTH